ncbi:hypothetical protein ANAPRD1_00268 [Anaplasma phagocytophilum]|uniref:hypothetical protein n=1 Tax=Anaplasma phagocytophilum TaxID=948 RepID=UPI0007E15272|nr:hypothetical protein [Anaplasma phagocytophilum]SCV61512.1 hypothetical protein ANAPH1_00008 [Anaplasma phagocytophilum]SCV62732.1 hypothetical protein ANAPRD1_00268 [Anaplasma phagocytophilum]
MILLAVRPFDRSRTEILCLTNYVWQMFCSVSVLEPREMAMDCMGSSGGSIGRHFMYAAICIVVAVCVSYQGIASWLGYISIASASSDFYLSAYCITFQGRELLCRSMIRRFSGDYESLFRYSA